MSKEVREYDMDAILNAFAPLAQTEVVLPQQQQTAGVKHDNGKPDMSLIPMAAALEEAAVWTFGKKKYDAWNWYKGLKYSQILSAMERHLTLLKAGQDFDYENGLHNAAAIRCCAAMLITFCVEKRSELDDRIPMSVENQEIMNKMAQGKTIKELLSEKPK
jgi:Domain of unknown function (DUF5664)